MNNDYIVYLTYNRYSHIVVDNCIKEFFMSIYSDLFSATNQEVDREEAFYLQNSKLLKVELKYGPVKAINGSMIAYQGNAFFKRKGSGGLKKFVMKNITGEGDNLMDIEGDGEVFLGHGNGEVKVLFLENDAVVVNSANLLAFSDSLDEHIERVKTPGSYLAGGLFNTRLEGTGYVAIITAGHPFSLKVSPHEAPITADPEAVVLWTPGVRTNIKVDTGGLGTMFRGGTGESVQMGFTGEGIVVCQSSELMTKNEQSQQN